MPALERITLDNAMQFKAVRLAALLDSPRAFGGTYAKESKLSDAEWVERAGVWSSARSVGYLAMDWGNGCGIAAGFLDEHDPAKAHLVSMWVAPTHRRCGTGGALIDAVVAWARERGVNAIHLMVASGNNAAIKFYVRNGFAMTGKSEPYPNDSNLVEYEMWRAIA